MCEIVSGPNAQVLRNIRHAAALKLRAKKPRTQLDEAPFNGIRGITALYERRTKARKAALARWGK